MDTLQHHLWTRFGDSSILSLPVVVGGLIDICLFVCSCFMSGEQYQPVLCFEVDVGVVDDSLCDRDTQPEDRYRKCKNMDCPARSAMPPYFFN